jgi:glycosyltransferase involved in cell wall biosynthesis
MNVLFTESSPNLGGQELQILLQMAALGRQGHRCVLACRPSSAIARAAAERQLDCVHVPFRNSLHLPSVLTLRQLIRTRRIDLAICHSGHDANTLSLAARLMGKRPRLVRSRTYQPGIPKAFSYNHAVDRTIVPSAYLRKQLLRNPAIAPARIEVVRPIVPFDTLREAARAPLPTDLAEWLAGRGPVIVQAAMLRPEKGHRIMLQAFASLRQDHPDAVLVFAGSGPEAASLAQLSHTLGVSGAVCFAGLVQPVAPLLAKADLVVMPSLEEPLGLSQVEALALGTPVVVSDAGGLPETVLDGVTGRVVPRGDAAALARAVHETLSDLTQARTCAAAGQAWVTEHFAEATHVMALEHLLADAHGTL